MYENHGLMRRMYGHERHISVLRSEIESNDVEYQSESGWSFHDHNLKSYQPRTNSVPSSSSTTTTTTTTTPIPSPRSTTQESTTLSDINTNTTEDTLTTELDVDTTLEYESTTVAVEVEHKSQTVHQHELFEKGQPTEEPQLYKLRGVSVLMLYVILTRNRIRHVSVMTSVQIPSLPSSFYGLQQFWT